MSLAAAAAQIVRRNAGVEQAAAAHRLDRDGARLRGRAAAEAADRHLVLRRARRRGRAHHTAVYRARGLGSASHAEGVLGFGSGRGGQPCARCFQSQKAGMRGSDVLGRARAESAPQPWPRPQSSIPSDIHVCERARAWPAAGLFVAGGQAAHGPARWQAASAAAPRLEPRVRAERRC